MKYLGFLIVAVLASSCSFLIHLFSAEWLMSWVAEQMKDHSVTPSWNVRNIALFTSIEYGIAAVIMYQLMRDKLIQHGRFIAIIIFAILLTAIHGALFRQPFMDFVVGNPLHVTLVQNIFKWLVWLLISVVVVNGVETIRSYTKKDKKC